MTTHNSKVGWQKWLTENSTKNKYNSNAGKVKVICNAANYVINFEKLVLHKNLVLLTEAPLGAEIQTSFFHSTVGVPIIPDDLYHIARIGITTGSGMEVGTVQFRAKLDMFLSTKYAWLFILYCHDYISNLVPSL